MTELTPAARRMLEAAHEHKVPLPYWKLDSFTAALNAMAEAAQPQWQPMETAPRDGTPVWLCVPGMQTEAWYAPLEVSENHEGFDTSRGSEWVCAEDQWRVAVEEIYNEDGTVEYFDGHAMAWMPLPKPPAPGEPT